MILKAYNGADVTVLQDLDIGGKKFFLVDFGSDKYINGLLVKYAVVPTSQFDKSSIIQEKAEVVQ